MTTIRAVLDEVKEREGVHEANRLMLLYLQEPTARSIEEADAVMRICFGREAVHTDEEERTLRESKRQIGARRGQWRRFMYSRQR